MNTSTTTKPARKIVVLSIANASEAERAFIKGIVAIFTDPAAQPHADLVRSGELAIQMHPDTGEVYLFPTTTATATTPVELQKN